MNQTVSIHTLVGEIIEITVETPPTRKGILCALHALNEERFPLLQTDVVRTEQGDWFAMILPELPCIQFRGVKSIPHRKKEGVSFHLYSFDLFDDAYHPSILQVEPTERQLQMASYGNPLTLCIIESNDPENERYGIQHEYSKNGRVSQTYCVDCAQRYTVLEDQLNHCSHSVQVDGTCQQLSKEVAAYILRVYEVMSIPFE